MAHRLVPRLRSHSASSNVVISMVTVIASPYAASIPPELRNIATVSRHPAISDQFTAGIYNCPLAAVIYFILSLGHRPRFTASEKIVNDPLSSAWLAIMAAPVDMATPAIVNHGGIMA